MILRRGQCDTEERRVCYSDTEEKRVLLRRGECVTV